MHMPRLRTRDWLPSLFFLAACLALAFLDFGTPGRTEGQEGLFHAKARILDVDDSTVRVDGMIRTGEEVLRVKILSGDSAGTEMAAVNFLTGQMALDERYAPGDALLLQYSLSGADEPVQGVARGHYRTGGFLALLALFAALLVAVAGWTGLRALLSFVFAGLMLWKVLIPLYLSGWNPILTAVPVVAAIAACVCLLVGGTGARGLAALAGTILGLALTLALGIACTGFLHIHGAVYSYSETLLYSGFPNLALTPIFISGIVIGCSGAVMDVAMDVASAMDEVRRQNPGITFREHLKSGLSVGGAVTGTMTTTLLLAYSSSAAAMLMLFHAQGLPLERIANINSVAAEIVNILVGSIGAVAVAPLTALAGVLFMARSRKKPR